MESAQKLSCIRHQNKFRRLPFASPSPSVIAGQARAEERDKSRTTTDASGLLLLSVVHTLDQMPAFCPERRRSTWKART